MSGWKPRFGTTWVVVIGLLQAWSLYRGWQAPVQPLLAVVFVSTTPGFVLLDLEQPADWPARLLLGIAVSLAANVVAVTAWLLPSPVWMVPAAAFVVWGWRRQRRVKAGEGAPR